MVDSALTLRDGRLQKAQTASDVVLIPDVFMLTAIGGFAVRMKNRTGGTSVKGTLLAASDAAFNGAGIAASNAVDVIGAMYESGVAAGDDCWVVVGGAAEVKLENDVASTRGHWVGSSSTSGRALTKSAPSSQAEHFQEVGHCVQTVAGDPAGALCRIIMHFN